MIVSIWLTQVPSAASTEINQVVWDDELDTERSAAEPQDEQDCLVPHDGFPVHPHAVGGGRGQLAEERL